MWKEILEDLHYQINIYYQRGLWRILLEITLLWGIVYTALKFMKGSRGLYLLRGFVGIIISFFLLQFIFQYLKLYVLSWLLTKFFALSLFILIVVFHIELREGFISLGKRGFFHITPDIEVIDKVLKEIVKAFEYFSHNHIGAILAIKREMSMKNYIDSGVKIDACVSAELLESIFYPNNPLHDGGVVIDNDRIVAASCLFPLTMRADLSKTIGTRHRAAIGLSEETDAVVIVSSEETGNISLAIGGHLSKNLSIDDLYTILKGQFIRRRR